MTLFSRRHTDNDKGLLFRAFAFCFVVGMSLIGMLSCVASVTRVTLRRARSQPRP